MIVSKIELGTYQRECVYKEYDPNNFVIKRTIDISAGQCKNYSLNCGGGWFDIKQNLLKKVDGGDSTLYNYCRFWIGGIPFYGYVKLLQFAGGIYRYQITTDATTTAAYNSCMDITGDFIVEYGATGNKHILDGRQARNPVPTLYHITADTSYSGIDALNARYQYELPYINGSIVLTLVDPIPSIDVNKVYDINNANIYNGGAFNISTRTYIMPWQTWSFVLARISARNKLWFHNFDGSYRGDTDLSANQSSAFAFQSIVNLYWIPFPIQMLTGDNYSNLTERVKEISFYGFGTYGSSDDAGQAYELYANLREDQNNTDADYPWENSNHKNQVRYAWKIKHDTKAVSTSLPIQQYMTNPLVYRLPDLYLKSSPDDTVGIKLTDGDKMDARVIFNVAGFGTFEVHQNDYDTDILSLGANIYFDLTGQSYIVVLIMNGTEDYRQVMKGQLGTSFPVMSSDSKQNWSALKAYTQDMHIMHQSVNFSQTLMNGNIFTSIADIATFFGAPTSITMPVAVSGAAVADVGNTVISTLTGNPHISNSASSAQKSIFEEEYNYKNDMRQLNEQEALDFSPQGQLGSAGLFNYHPYDIYVLIHEYKDNTFNDKYGYPDMTTHNWYDIKFHAKQDGNSSYVKLASPLLYSCGLPVEFLQSASKQLCTGVFLY